MGLGQQVAGLFGNSGPPVQSEELRDCAAMLAEAKMYSKNLKKFLEAVMRFEKATDTVAVTSQAVLDCSGPATDGMNQARGRLSSDMAAGVRAPASEWLLQYKAVKDKHKQLLKLAGEYSKAQVQVEKASSKLGQAQAKGVEQVKQDKLHGVVEQKAHAFEAAKTAFVCSAPEVASEFRTLLRKRDELKLQLYALFAVSGRALADMAKLNPNPSGGAVYIPPSTMPSAQGSGLGHMGSAGTGMPHVGGAYDYAGAQAAAANKVGSTSGSSGGYPSPGTPLSYPLPPAAGKGARQQQQQQEEEEDLAPYTPVV